MALMNELLKPHYSGSATLVAGQGAVGGCVVEGTGNVPYVNKPTLTYEFHLEVSMVFDVTWRPRTNKLWTLSSTLMTTFAAGA